MRYNKKKQIVRLRKLYRYIMHSFGIESKEKNDPIQTQTYLNIRRIISKKDSKLSLSPESHLCYAEWNNYFIKFSDTSATITNGKFSYYVWLPTKMTDKLRKQFYSTIESRIKVSVDVYNHNTLKNLKEIGSELK